MKILIVGSGGREHALAWKIAKSEKVTQIFVAPGNPGTVLESKVTNVDISATDIDALVAFAKEFRLDLTVIGPEAPLSLGVVDRFNEEGLACFGPTQKAAQLESSKAFAKAFMVKEGIPTAAYQSFHNPNLAKAYVRKQSLPIVIKADGLAAGKGVVIAESLTLAEQTIDAMLQGKQFGEAGQRIVIEEFLKGEEASFIAICDGKHAIAFASSQDHKARDEGDKGPNTGGMGAYSPAPIVTPSIEEKVLKEVIQPALSGMANAGTPYVGFLYAGLMIAPNGDFKVLEFNCRLGDPEAEVLLMRLTSDLVELCQMALKQQLHRYQITWDPRPALGVVLASGGYPDHFQKGFTIDGLEELLANCKIFHASTALHEGKVVNNGGRVLCVCAIAESLPIAKAQTYAQINKIHWEGMFYRKDIGHRAIK